MTTSRTSKDPRAIRSPAYRQEFQRLIEETIDTAVAERPELANDIPALFKLVADAYPYQRKHRPLRIWLEELRRARKKLEPETYSEAPIDRLCTTCGANPGKPCRPVGDDDPIATELIMIGDAAPHGRGRRSVALSLVADVVHASRREPHGPLLKAGGTTR